MVLDETVFETAVGVDLGGSKLLIRYRDRWLRCATGRGFGGAELTAQLLRFLDEQAQSATALGIAVPGLVEDGVRVAACDVLPSLAGWDLRASLGARVAALALVNDAKAALHATTAGLSPGAVAVTVMAGTAIGCGIVAGAGVLGGASGWAGELGYWPMLRADGRWTRLDEIAGGGAMEAHLGIGGQELAKRAAAGDEAVLKVIAEGGQALGGALAGVVNLLNPRHLAVGGGALRLPGYWKQAQAVLRAQAIAPMLAACEVHAVHAIEDLVARGAAGVALALRSRTDPPGAAFLTAGRRCSG